MLLPADTCNGSIILATKHGLLNTIHHRYLKFNTMLRKVSCLNIIYATKPVSIYIIIKHEQCQ